MNELIVYAQDGYEKILIGTFESLDNIQEEVKERLDELGVPYLTQRHIIYAQWGLTSSHRYKLVWGKNKK